MTDRPILFSAPMVRALLEGRKTQTRRPLYVVRNAKETGEMPPSRYFPDYPPPNLGLNQIATLGTAHLIQPGDRLWVKETWRTNYGLDFYDDDLGRCPKPTDMDPETTAIEYLADGERELGGKTRVSLFMRRWMSRLTLTVTDVRIERLQDISREDAIAEGIEHCPDKGLPPSYWRDYLVSEARIWFGDPVQSYRSLWNSINGAGAWEANPWVVAISFDVEQRNIDDV